LAVRIERLVEKVGHAALCSLSPLEEEGSGWRGLFKVRVKIPPDLNSLDRPLAAGGER
jgi:hypothetical protein